MTQLAPRLVQLLQLAYSAELAATFAYQGHAGSLRDPEQVAEVQRIENEERHHRSCVCAIMDDIGVSPSSWYEWKYSMIGKIICVSCYLIGWFMPMYFAGRLESGNVNEYIEMKALLNAAGITRHDAIVDEMTWVEKDHEVFFLEHVTGHWMLPLFQVVFRWGPGHSYNALPSRSAEE
jgi:hypothetical protein